VGKVSEPALAPRKITVKMRLPAGPDDRFTPEAAASMIGQTPKGATVEDARLIEDGAAVELTITYEVPAASASLLEPDLRGFSIGPNA
jgi:hypothetical protein